MLNNLNPHRQRQLFIEAIYQYYIFDLSPKELVNRCFLQSPQWTKEQLDKLNECLEKSVNMEYIIDEYLSDNWSFWRLANTEKAILILAIYELITTKIDKKIIINEAIILAKEYGEIQSYKLINGVLDKICKNLDQVKTKYYEKNL